MGMTGREIWRRYRLRHKRRYLLIRALRRFRRDLTVLVDRTQAIRSSDILGFATVRNEALRLPRFLDHHRQMGVAQFLIVDNGSTDGTLDYLRAQPDVSLWSTQKSYRSARFGMDWINALLMRYGHGHWCLTLDADECLILPHHDSRDLRDLTAWLDARGERAFAAMMLDLYATGPLEQVRYTSGQAFEEALSFYDAFNYTWERSPKYRDIQIHGGPRARVLFADQPELAPHLHKIPLIFWNWRYAYVSSTHVALPDSLNHGFDARLDLPTGALLHSKLLPDLQVMADLVDARSEYHHDPALYDGYFERLRESPVFDWAEARRYRDWRDLEADGILTRGQWI